MAGIKPDPVRMEAGETDALLSYTGVGKDHFLHHNSLVLRKTKRGDKGGEVQGLFAPAQGLGGIIRPRCSVTVNSHSLTSARVAHVLYAHLHTHK